MDTSFEQREGGRVNIPKSVKDFKYRYTRPVVEIAVRNQFLNSSLIWDLSIAPKWSYLDFFGPLRSPSFLNFPIHSMKDEEVQLELY